MKKRISTSLLLLMLFTLPLLSLLGAQKEAQDKADKNQPAAKELPDRDLFGLTKVWQFHLELTTNAFEKMQPTGGMRSPGGFGPKKSDNKTAGKPADVHKGSGFGLEFPYVPADLSAEGKKYKESACATKVTPATAPLPVD